MERMLARLGGDLDLPYDVNVTILDHEMINAFALPGGQVFIMSVDGGEAEQLFTHVNAIQRIHPSPDGSSIAFTATGAPP